jgi:branched-chain amino acid transport system substrate-binding protein
MEGAADGPVIGFAIELSGYGASSGANIREGAQLAAKDVNAHGGINGQPLRLIFEDTQTTAQGAVSAARKLIETDHVPVIVSGWTFETEAIAPITENSDTVLVSASAGGLRVGALGEKVFRTWPSDKYDAYASAEFLYAKGHRRAVILCTEGIWEQGLRNAFRERFEQLGGSIASEACQTTARDWRTTLLKQQAAQPDAMYLALDTAAMPSALRQMKELNINTTRMYNSWAEDAQVQAAGDAREGLYYPQYTDMSATFKELFEREYGHSLGAPADVAYDTVMVIAQSMQASGTTAEFIASGLRSTNYTGVSGAVVFDKNRDRIARPMRIMHITNGTSQ